MAYVEASLSNGHVLYRKEFASIAEAKRFAFEQSAKSYRYAFRLMDEWLETIEQY